MINNYIISFKIIINFYLKRIHQIIRPSILQNLKKIKIKIKMNKCLDKYLFRTKSLRDISRKVLKEISFSSK